MDLKKIVQAYVSIRNQMHSLLPDISEEITSIIESNDTSVLRIEELLDTLLNFGQMGVGESEFVRLNSYYALFNREYAGEYSKTYREMNEE